MPVASSGSGEIGTRLLPRLDRYVDGEVESGTGELTAQVIGAVKRP